MDLDKSLYFFRISQGRYSGASDQPYEFESREAAWVEMTAVCSNLLGGISRSLKENAEWRMELLDEAKKPVFRIRLVAARREISKRLLALYLPRLCKVAPP
jgi:hypothetical protein